MKKINFRSVAVAAGLAVAGLAMVGCTTTKESAQGSYGTRQASLELSYERTQHDGSFAGEFAMDSTFQAFNIDARYFVAPTRRIQPAAAIIACFFRSTS